MAAQLVPTRDLLFEYVAFDVVSEMLRTRDEKEPIRIFLLSYRMRQITTFMSLEGSNPFSRRPFLPAIALHIRDTLCLRTKFGQHQSRV